ARGPFVHREITADAMAGAVVEVEALRPQELAREGIELRAGRPFGKDGAGDRNMAPEHAGEAVPHLRGGLADRDGAGDIRGAILVLGAGVNEKEFARCDEAIAFGRDTVMDDCPVRPGAGDGRERYVLEQPGVAAKAFERRYRIDLREFAARSLPLEPGEETRNGRAVADLRRARAGDLDVVLDCLHQADRAGRLDGFAAAVGKEARERVGGGALVDPHAVLSPAQVLERVRESGRLAQIGEGLEANAHLVGELSAVAIQRRP